MKTVHNLIIGDARDMQQLDNESVDLIVTSPPYPMIEMWDEMFAGLNPSIRTHLHKCEGDLAFQLMHVELDKAWKEAYRVLKNGGIICINVGDATRRLGENFRMYSNHARILQSCLESGFSVLPCILWRKQTNSPNKFLGSGMLPPGAYVTLEHEHILIMRKGDKRKFSTTKQKHLRRQSAFFWEERNMWFTDVWDDLKGVKQQMDNHKERRRSAAFPVEIPFRLIQMFSLRSDTVLDPFLGTGTTMAAAVASGRNSVGIEALESLVPVIAANLIAAKEIGNDYIAARMEQHTEFVKSRVAAGKPLKHSNQFHNAPVMTSHETDLQLVNVLEVKQDDVHSFVALYDTTRHDSE